MASDTEKQRTFLRYLFGESDGFLCLAFLKLPERKFREEFYKYPEQLDKILDTLSRTTDRVNAYFCHALLPERKRDKTTIVECPFLWADLDDCPPEALRIPPTLVLETSPNRYQAFWKLDEPAPLSEAVALTKSIAYAHQDSGADISGWDPTQVLRIPLTWNTKYSPPFKVRIAEAESRVYTLAQIQEHYEPMVDDAYEDIEFPDELPPEPDDVIQKYRDDLSPQFWTLYEDEPKGDWSAALWTLELILFEAGTSPVEAFSVANESASNKYKRDKRSPTHLWKEICKAHTYVQEKNKPTAERVVQSVNPSGLDQTNSPAPLLTEEERLRVKATPTVVESYIHWASRKTDAPTVYHQAVAFSVLSSLLCGRIRVEMGHSLMPVNLWFMLLADTTLTRKSTSMEYGRRFIDDVDQSILVATDGSVEGIVSSLADRAAMPSLIFRDEISGWIESMAKKDYLSGMQETLTQLYDGTNIRRRLRTETIEVRQPRLVFLAGGAKRRTIEAMTEDHITSGFLPRFILVEGTTDLSKLRPAGTVTPDAIKEENELLRTFRQLYEFYNPAMTSDSAANVVHINTGETIAELTDDARARMQKIEASMLSSAVANDDYKDLYTPIAQRLFNSGMKCAALLAATRMEKPLILTEEDVIRGFFYVEEWRETSLSIIDDIQQTPLSSRMSKVLNFIRGNGGETLRGEIGRKFHLSKRELDEVMSTLEDQGLVKTDKAKGRGGSIMVRTK